MTGTQDSMTSGEELLRMLRGLGVDERRLHVLNPLPQHHEQNVALMRAEIDHHGLSVIVPTRACIHVRRKERGPGIPAVTARSETAAAS
jgi:indolepyruvate ferredoxin oxidoreductase alpha subunit